MRRTILIAAAALALCVGAQLPVQGQIPGLGGAGGPKFEDFSKVTQGAKEIDGLFKLFHKDDTLYAEIRPDQLERPLLCPIAIARGMAMGGYTLNFDEQWVLLFKRPNPTGDKLQL